MDVEVVVRVLLDAPEARELGIEPGPELGRLLREIEAAVYVGEVSNREEALETARSALQGPAGGGVGSRRERPAP